MKTRAFTALAFLCLNFAKLQANSYDILSPSTRSSVYGSETLLVMSVDKDQMDRLEIFVNHRFYSRVKIREGEIAKGSRVLIRKRIPLKFGVNQVSIQGTALDSSAKVEELEIFATTRPQILSASVNLPPGFEGKRFHSLEMEKTLLEFYPDSKMGLSYCFSCHAKQGMYFYRHAPTRIEFGCAYCHDYKSSPNRYVLSGQYAENCLTCHKTFLEKKVLKNSHPHGPAASNQCQACHNPHGSNRDKKFLHLPVNQLCATCHGDQTMKHADGGAYQDVLTADSHRALNCAHCHMPHGSNARLFFKRDGDEPTTMCSSCHVGAR